MALIENKISNIHIWENSETLTTLLDLLQDNEIHREVIAGFKSEDRIRQYLTSRLLVQEAIGDFKIVKGANSKPYLENSSLEISFTHNKPYTILMTSTIPCGVDVQAPTEKAVRIKSKFINANDFCFESNQFETLSKAWSCKEAAFKKFGTQEIFLKENITIVQELPNKIYKVRVEFDNEQHEVLLKQEIIENNYLFYTIN